jgi:hypothetical protein
MVELNSEEAQVVLALVDRTQVSGKEAATVAFIQNKLKQGIDAPKEEPKEDKTKK